MRLSALVHENPLVHFDARVIGAWPASAVWGDRHSPLFPALLLVGM